VTDVLESVDKILDLLSNKPVTAHQIVCKTGLHRLTVKKYLTLIEKIQSSGEVKKEIRGSRVYFIKE
jgi:DNA invertase Pin-like site-specific DNA recombinase